MRRLRILEAAAGEAVEAAGWYEIQRPGLGTDFEQAIDAALDLLQEDILPLSPMTGIAGRRGAKRLGLRRFPYDIIVRQIGDEIVVIAFAHQSRRPGYWRDR
jgi:toxin ParE1/3/4